MINKNRLTKTFLDLVKIDSISLKEGKMKKYLIKECKKLGIKLREDNAAKKLKSESGNLFGYVKGIAHRRSPALLINAHIDTVEPGIGVKPIVQKGIIKTDGKTILGSDDKAGVAIMLEVMKVLKEKKIPHTDIQIVFTVAEEIGLEGAKCISKKDLKADMGVALDGSEPHVILNQAPAQDSISVEVYGRAAHAGIRPEEGINAIKVASNAIDQMRLGRIDFETTANIGIISGGKATNIIPEKVYIKGEARSHSAKKLKKQVDHMKSCFAKACKKHKAKYKIKIIREYNSFNIKENNEIVKIAKKAVQAFGKQPVIRPSGGGSDANIFNKLGVPTIIMGFGMKKVHTTDEYISIENLVGGAKVLLKLINEIH